MRIPTVTDATARSIALTLAGALLLMIVPRDAMGTATITQPLGLVGPTAAQLFGVALVFTGWVYFVVVVVVLHAVKLADRVCPAAVVLDGAGIVLFLGLALTGWTVVSAICLALSMGSKVSIARTWRRQQRPESQLRTL